MLGDDLRRLREARGLGVRELADRAGISHASLVALESAKRYPSLRTLEALASALHMNVVIGPDETIVEPLP
jgi:transcriptional regulator with XRE-family HTH domain